jgi:hypothetical protein
MRAVCMLLALAGCNGTPPGDPLPEGVKVECALAGATQFTPDCTMERAQDGAQKFVTLRHPDGGFRRLEIGVEGRGIIAADGADQAVVTPGEGVVEVTVGPDRYRLPVAH